jgi:predicted phosphodiesterase
MRLMPISDLHLEQRSLTDIPALDEPFDVLVCAGDIWEGQPERAVQSIVELANGRPSIIIPGSHDLYTEGPEDRRTMSEFVRLLRLEAERQNATAHRDLVTVLSTDEPVCEIGCTRFIGLTLWTDWVQSSRWVTAEGPTRQETCAAEARAIAGHWRSGSRDYRAIRTERGFWTPYDSVAEHARQRAQLIDELTSFHHGPTVVVTHHSPLGESADAYRSLGVPWWTPAYYCSDILPILADELRPEIWIFGHVHIAFDQQCGRTRALTNPIEGNQFKSNLIVEL